MAEAALKEETPAEAPPPQGKPKRNGIVEIKNKKGVVVKRITYVDDLKEGPAEFFGDDGKLVKKATYVADLLDGLRFEYDPKGQVEAQMTFSQGVLNGEMNKYKDGKLLMTLTFVNGLKEGMCTRYFPNGTDVKVTTPYKADLREGKETIMGGFGHPVKERTFVADKLDGDCYSYVPDTGARIKWEKFQNGLLQGDTVIYDARSGNITKIITYDQDKPTQVQDMK